jgi:alkanesulfonate monooxygenase SsuD/methylene tetrahydromethanopterin reductase-like flavin-dependent oxidoreductase (luciferase family)
VSSLTFGVALDFGAREQPLNQRLAWQTTILKRAEEVGFQAVATGELHASGMFHLPNPLLVLAAIAQQTSLQLITGIVVLPAWDPWKLAMDTALLDQLTGGRLVLGVGLGRRADRRLGQWRDDAIGRTMEETLEAIRALWVGADGYSGQYVSVHRAIPILPAQPRGPRIWVAGAMRRSAERAAHLGDGWYAGIDLLLQAIEAQVAVYHSALRRLGRDVTRGAVGVNRLTLGAERSADAEWLAERFLGEELRVHSRGGRAADISLVGGPDELIRLANGYAEAGVTRILARLSLEDMPVEVVTQTIDIFGRHVIPVFA